MAILLVVAATLVLALAAFLGLRRPAVVLTLYMATVPFGSAIGLPLGLRPPFDTPSSVLGLAAIVVLVADATIGSGRHRGASFTAAHALFVAFVGVCALTIGWTIDRVSTVEDLVLLLSVVGLFLAGATLRLTERGFEQLASSIAVGGIVASLYGIALLQAGAIAGGRSGVPRFALTGRDPNHTAASLLLPVLIAADRALDPGRPWQHRAGWAGGAVTTTVAIASTGSRGGLLALLVGFIVLLRLRVPGMALKVGAATAVAVVLIVLTVTPPALERRLSTPSTTGRSDIWRLGLRSCEQYCLLGSGWGSFPKVNRDEFRQAADVGGYRGGGYRAHNIWLQALVETGLAGFAMLAGAWIALLRQVLRLPEHLRAVPLAALSSMTVASSLVSNLTFKYLWLLPMYVVFATQLAGLDRRSRTHRYDDRLPSRTR